MRIAHMFDMFHPGAGGTVKLIADLARAQAKLGHVVDILTSDYMLDQSYIDGFADEENLHIKTMFCASDTANLFVIPELREHLERSVYDIVHCHTARSYQNVILHMYGKVAYVLDTHGSLPRKVVAQPGLVKPALKYVYDVMTGIRILRDAALCIAETNMGIEEYKSRGVPEDRIRLIRPSFNLSEFKPLPIKGVFRGIHNLRKPKKIVMFLGRIHEIKGLDFLVRGFAAMRNDKSALVFVGNDDGYKDKLDRLIDELGIAEQVLYTGFLGGRDKLVALRDADVVVQTSRYEQGAWAPLEAVLCETPIIVSSNSGAGEDIAKLDCGYLIEYGDVSGLACLMDTVIHNAAGVKEKTLKGKARITDELSLEKNVERYLTAYKEAREIWLHP